VRLIERRTVLARPPERFASITSVLGLQDLVPLGRLAGRLPGGRRGEALP
jgi:hypothetical protein